MECNKDEAIRAKNIAEKKLENNDFEGAQKMAKRAQSIYPELENIMQLITICDVHCSSAKRLLGSDKDWYAILKVDCLADQLTIRKQYRRLALFLHPDKNRFPGAESAFKLICEANAVLSDPVKKSLYDNKIKVSSRSAPANAPTVNINKKKSQFPSKRRPQNSVYSNLNRHQAAQSSSSTRLDAFWTACPSWNSVPENHEFKYEIVEVLSDFVAGSGVEVRHLDKIRGFVSLFQRTSQSKSFFVGPKELYRFSHRVPCFKMTGHETAGVPEGSFELDPASLPLNPDNLYYPGKATTEREDVEHGVNGSSAESAKQRSEPMISEGKSTAKDYVEGTDSESLKLRRSPRKMKFSGKKGN